MTTGPNVRPGEKPPRFPAQARQRTENGALQFAGYYFKAYDWGYATNDPLPVTRIALETCRGCAIYINGLRDLKRQHAILVGGRVRIRSAAVFRGTFRVRADYAVDVAVDETAVVIRAPGSPPRTAAPLYANYHSLVFVRWTPAGWKVVEVTSR